MKRFKSRIKMLNETISYFWGRPERKCVDKFGVCRFSPTNTHTQGCALGRYFPKKLCISLDKFETSPRWPKWIDDNRDFVISLRDLHDSNAFVNKDKDKVLSVMGYFVNSGEIIFPD